MDYGGYLVIAILMLAGIFFSLALYYRNQIQVLKFTSYGLAMLVILGLISAVYTNSVDLKIAVFAFIFLSAVYYWFYRGSLQDKKRQ